MKYLIVDDNPNMRKIIKQVVCSSEDDVMELTDGNEGLAAYSKYLPDYVLMDIQMQGMDGLTATKKIKDKFPSARVIIVTDYDIPSFRIAAKMAGACAFVSKENLSNVKEFIENNFQMK